MVIYCNDSRCSHNDRIEDTCRCDEIHLNVAETGGILECNSWEPWDDEC